MKTFFRNIGSVVLVSLFLISCDDTYISSIPDYPVYLELNLVTTYPIFRNSYNRSLTFLTPVTAVERIGYGGILVYTGFDGAYYAFDMSCPYEHLSTVRVYPNELGQAVCEKCGTVYDIGYGVGNPTKRIRPNLPDTTALAKEVLKQYKTTYSGYYLYVTQR
ncbi:MAG: TFIIB-type zinc ribbon-containing protein [Paludibacter sp.]